MLKKLTLSVKINILIGLFIASNIAFFVVFLNGQVTLRDTAVDTTKTLIDSTERIKVKTAVLNMAHVLEKDVKNINKDSIEELYEFFNERLGDLKYEADRSGYYFICKGTTWFFNPNNRAVENKDYVNSRDVNGVRYIYDLNQKANSGGGYVIYKFLKPGKGEVNKVSYATMINGTDYWIASGVYLDNIKNSQNTLQSAIEEKSKDILSGIIIPVLLIVLTLVLFSINIRSSIIKPITEIIKNTNRVAIGELRNITNKGNDELSKVVKSLNNLINRLKETSAFARSIGDGNFNTEFEIKSEEDVLGRSLLDMRNSLNEARKAEEKRAEEEEIRIWTMNGHTIMNDILRENQHRIDMLADMLLQKIIEYVKLNQGGIFLRNQDDDTKLELISSYAYDRKKFLEKSIEIGEGIVGTCAIEQKTIYMTDVPDNYISIGSGLGDAKPSCLIIVPLIINEKFYGVIELASFNKLKEHEIAFIEKTAENIASTISIAQITMNTTKLLEQHKMQSEELSAQEEEMRQNMEELQATQEESARRERELTEKVGYLEKILDENNLEH
ncbi:MAG: cache domain-containing protein [Bacteroidales bacterium]|jgi:putative methionine-R-sulfoxide reductase with GAF domain|nr:cache domain-containing protein [Bacteroidales bacterium]